MYNNIISIDLYVKDNHVHSLIAFGYNTDVRIVAATNFHIPDAIRNGKFRQDLFYRLNTVPIFIPPLKERKDDIVLLFRKFASDFAEKYRMPPLILDEEAKKYLVNYRWSGNIRQLKNITEQISIIEGDRNITKKILLKYLPQDKNSDLPVLYQGDRPKNEFTERDLLYKVLFDMKKDVNDLKKLVHEIIQDENIPHNIRKENLQLINELYNGNKTDTPPSEKEDKYEIEIDHHDTLSEPVIDTEIIEESLSLQEKEIDLIKKALEKHKGKRKLAAKELGISERTLYRKIKEYDIG
jgi:transcriptional regulator with PAS, ATPase and Fis domain